MFGHLMYMLLFGTENILTLDLKLCQQNLTTIQRCLINNRELNEASCSGRGLKLKNGPTSERNLSIIKRPKVWRNNYDVKLDL